MLKGISSSALLCLLLMFVSNSAAGTQTQAVSGISQLIIPKIHVNVMVVQGTADDAAVPGPQPVHYLNTALPGEGHTVVISGHHFTHPLPGAAAGVFYQLDRLVKGDPIFLTKAPLFGAGRIKYIVASNRPVSCGHTPVGFYDCPPAVNMLKHFGQNKVYLITCIGDGYQRRIVTAFAAKQ